ncbi:MAG: NAD(P)H-hydrate dehydratase [Ignavibacteriae bacterium]|nr:NAD(P)H-hydrate dehydratase [Ignavibacteriota bacterium]
MQTVVSAEQMRWCDATTIKSYGVPSLILMENAGSSVAWFVEEHFGPLESRHVVILCGKGNNGGDGFVAARHLVNQGATVSVVTISNARELMGDAKTNFSILARIGKSTEQLTISQYSSKLLKSLHPDIIIDALLGTGFSGAVRKPLTDAIQWMNESRVPVVAADIPSGVDATTGIVENIAVQASATVTFGLLKSGLFCNQGQDSAGDVLVADIGIPKSVSTSDKFQTFLIERSDVRSLLPRRPSTSHKYSVGKVLVIAGSKGYTGAAALAAMSALRAGAGAVMLATPESVYPVLARKLTEAIVAPFSSTPEGSLSTEALAPLREKIQWADVVVIGPGLSQHKETQRLVQQLVFDNKSKMLIDADALNALAGMGVSKLKKSKGSFLLTPHTGEFSRLSGMESKRIEQKRGDGVARDAATSWNATVVLKGGPTVTASSKGREYINSTSNPGMATVGSGDVLSGVISALWAQGMSDEDAAVAGVFVHGLSGDLACEKFGERSLVAQDLIDFLPAAFQEVERG